MSYTGIFTVSKEPLKLVEIFHEGELMTGVWMDVTPIWPSRASRKFYPLTVPQSTKDCWIQQGKRQYRESLKTALVDRFKTWLERII